MDDRDSGAGEERTVRLHFEIAGVSPRTVPVRRLARYLSLLSTALGDPKGLSLVAIGEGSLRAAFEASDDAVSGIRARVAALDDGTAPKRPTKALRQLRTELSADGAGSATLRRAADEPVLSLVPSTNGEREIGPIRDSGFVQGVPIRVGGRGEQVPVHLRNSGRVHHCEADQDLARGIAAHLFRTPLRVHGEGRWLRNGQGKWLMLSFRIRSFEELSDDPLGVVMARLRAIDAEWKKRPDPLGDLMRLRKGEDWTA